MKVSRVSSLVAMVAVVTLVLSGVAYARTTVYPTHLSIRRSPAGKIASGTSVTFSGRLTSMKHRCAWDSRIVLIRVGMGAVAHHRTDDAGRYVIHYQVWGSSRWRVKFTGAVLSAGHSLAATCRASDSAIVKIPVRK